MDSKSVSKESRNARDRARYASMSVDAQELLLTRKRSKSSLSANSTAERSDLVGAQKRSVPSTDNVSCPLNAPNTSVASSPENMCVCQDAVCANVFECSTILSTSVDASISSSSVIHCMNEEFVPVHEPIVLPKMCKKLADDDAARLYRNEKARLRYALMSLEKKRDLSNRRREQRIARNDLSTPAKFLGSDILSANMLNPQTKNLCNGTPAVIGSLLSSSSSVLPGTTSSSVEHYPSTFSQPLHVNPQPQRFNRIHNLLLDPWVLPKQQSCDFCGAWRFYREPPGFCCCSGQICLLPIVWSPILRFLFTDPTSEVASEFRRKNRSYNHAFAFTSIGIKVHPDSWWAREGIYSLKVHGKVSHFMRPVDGCANKTDLLQLFFLDTADDLDVTVLERRDVRQDIMALIIEALADNPYTKFFKRLRSWDYLADARIFIRSSPSLDQRNCNVPTADEVAGVWKDGDEAMAGSERDIRVYTEAGRSHKVNYYYSCYNPLQYPLLFSLGQPGWHPGIPKKQMLTQSADVKRKKPIPTSVAVFRNDVGSAEELLAAEEKVLQLNKRNRSNVSCREYTCYQAQIRDSDECCLLHAGRLGQEYIIDMYMKLETSRLDYYLSEQIQKELRTESLQGLIDSVLIDGETNPANVGQRIVLPSSFIGGPRDMRKRYVNAMALVHRFGKPDLFLTMTCNPAWKEITDNLLPCEKAHDRPDLVARVFKAKLEELKDEIVKKKLFGEVAAYVYTIEYQKRGLPHAHWVVILANKHKILSPTVYDEIICAELPDGSNPLLRAYVVKHMMHGPCGDYNKSCSCMREGRCKYYYPKEFSESTTNGQKSYPNYRRRNDGRSVMVHNVRLDNRSVVPYCPYLLLKFDCHINVEICADIGLVKYLYKYIYKGHTKLAYHVLGDAPAGQRNEIQEYQDGRWICAPEALWRIYAFPMSEMSPPVIALPVHLPNHQPTRFGLEKTLQQVISDPVSGRTMLTEFFFMNASNSEAKCLNLLYKEFPEYFVWEQSKRTWKIRSKQVVIGRLCTVNPFEGERYFERLLLSNVRCPTSFEALTTVGGKNYATFREAAVRKGLLESDSYVDGCLEEASLYQMPYSLRVLFAMLLVYGITGNPQLLWDKYYSALSEDFAQNRASTDIEILQNTVSAIDTVLTSMDRCIAEFPIQLPIVYSQHNDRYSKDYENEKCMYVSPEDMSLVNKLNAGQRLVYDEITDKINSNDHGVFFLDGPGGTGKTFLYRALLAYVRSRRCIALAVASSGVAASLLPGGRTAHSRFKLPFDPDDKTIGKISKQSSLAKMIIESKLIIWDEATMANRFSIESFEYLLRDFCDRSKPFGGKIVLFGGDFRQTLPIVVQGSREAMIGASFVSSSLWKSVSKLHLHENMRAKEDPSFTDFILRVGNGEIPYLFGDTIRMPSQMLIPFTDINESLDRLIHNVYPCFDTFITDPRSLVNRAILTPKNDCVGELNDLLLDRFPGQVKEYVSFNRANDSLQQVEYEEYLNSVSASGLPPHILRLKKNCPIMLLRNLNPIQGLCNGTRLICRELGDNFIGAEIATGDFKGNYVFIPRIPLESSEKLKCPIPFKRMQIPVKVCLAMTINKAQGQTLDFVGIYLREPVFSHGQLYVALSRAKSAASVKVLIHPDFEKNGHVDHTKNIVFREIFTLSVRVLIIHFRLKIFGCQIIFKFFYCIPLRRGSHLPALLLIIVYIQHLQKLICYIFAHFLHSRKMNTKTLHIKDINKDTTSWVVRVMVEEKTAPRRAANKSFQYQRMVLVDETGQKVSATIFEPHINTFRDMFDLYKTYTVSNAQVSKIDPRYDKFGYPYQWTINSKTACNPETETTIAQLIPNMEFASLSNLGSIAGHNVSVDVLVIVVQKKNQRAFTKEGKENILREYAVINQEKKLVILTLWNAIAEAEGELIDQAIHSFPIIKATKLSVSAYKDGSLGSTPSTTIELDPAIPQADILKTWRSDNMRFIVEEILVQDHFKRGESSGEFSTDKILLLADIPGEETVDKFTVQVCAKITKLDQKFYYMACAKCFSAIDADYNYSYTCAICKQPTQAKPRGRIQLTIYDDSGYIDVTMFGHQAINIMQMDSEMCMQLHDVGKPISAEKINQILEGKCFFMKIRKKTRQTKGLLQTQYVVMDMRPTTTEHQDNTHEQCNVEKPRPSQALTSSKQPFVKDRPSQSAHLVSQEISYASVSDSTGSTDEPTQ